VREIELLAEQDGCTPPPSAPNERWDIAMATVAGRARKENQDACAAWRQGDLQLLITADGVGGCPDGRLAAWLAVRAAAQILSRCVCRGHLQRDPDTCLMAAFRYAANALFEQALDSGQLGVECLRTTLIMLVCTPAQYLYGYMGDGGIVLRRQGGLLEQLLVPQKADHLRPNVLAASLGPNPQGQPLLGHAERLPNDFLFVGSDGVFDRVEDDFFQTLAEAARDECDGNLAKLVDEALEQLAAARDEAGYICDDNMTLALVANSVPERRAENEVAQPVASDSDGDPGNEGEGQHAHAGSQGKQWADL